MQHFRLCTITYGTACAPIQSLRLLKFLIELFEQTFPNSPWLQFLKELFDLLSYIDDFFGGADIIAESIEKRDALVTALDSAKIKLCKWSFNHKDILTGISEIGQAERPVNLHEVNIALGMKWSPVLDSFSFKLQDWKDATPIDSKRQVLSDMSKLYDPFGWVASVLIPFKIFLQDL